MLTDRHQSRVDSPSRRSRSKPAAAESGWTVAPAGVLAADRGLKFTTTTLRHYRRAPPRTSARTSAPLASMHTPFEPPNPEGGSVASSGDAAMHLEVLAR